MKQYVDIYKNMTNQENFKKDTEELFDLLKKYTRKYDFMGGRRMLQTPADLLEAQLRIALEIVRTDDENAKQSRKDCMC